MDTALFANPENRTLRGLLLPFGELSAPSMSDTQPIMFSAGTVELPADPAAFVLNEGHSQFEPRGHALSLEETDAGIVAEFQIARTPEGDAILERAANPDPAARPRLSAEVAGIVRDGIRAVSSRLTGAAFVEQGAFASAGLFSIAPDEAQALTDDVLTAIQDAVVTTVAAHVDSAPTTDPTQPTAPTNPTQGATMTAGQALASLANGTPAEKTDKTSAAGLFAALAEYGATQSKDSLAGYDNLGAVFAIQSVQNDGPGTGSAKKTIGADTAAPQVLNELWSRRAYERKYVPLVNSASLTNYTGTGWRWVEGKAPQVAEYNGNNEEIPSNEIDTEPVSFTAIRFAGGHKLDRRFRDFNDTTVFDSYFQHATEDYSRKTDAKTLANMVAGATAVTPGTVPTGVAKGLAAIIDGALSVITAENNPSFAVVSPELWRDIVLTGKDEVLGYLSASVGLETGTLDTFKFIPGAVGTGKVLVGAREAMTVYELAGVPIRVEGLDPHHGAIDPALFGYYASVVNNAKALALVTVAS